MRRYLGAITGREVIIEQDHSLPVAALRLGESRGAHAIEEPAGRDAVRWVPLGDGGVLRGGSERAVLHGVYALLERMGCQWSLFEEEQIAPRLDWLPAIEEFTLDPPFAVRGYVSDIMTWRYDEPRHLQAHLAEDAALVDWMAKTGGNTFFFIRHPIDDLFSIPQLLPEFEKRGITPEYGGHILPLLLPRDLFASYPEYFPVLAEGKRSNCGNACASNPEALAVIGRNAVECARHNPEMAVLHVWGADLWGGGWCRCERCAGLTPQDQSLLVCNAVATALEEASRARPVCYLAYHDTIDADIGVPPHPRVLVEFAPRERCYGHSISDPNCKTNERYRIALERYAEHFRGRVRVFEYYGDAILFYGCMVPNPSVVEADLRYFRSLGISEITLLQFGTHSHLAYDLSEVAFAAGTMGRSCDQALADHFALLGKDAAVARRTFEQLERIMRGLVTYGDIRRPPAASHERETIANRAARAAGEIRSLVREIDARGNRRLARQAALMRFTAAVLEGVAFELRGDSDRAETLQDQALQALQALGDDCPLWGRIDLPIFHAYYAASPAVTLQR